MQQQERSNNSSNLGLNDTIVSIKRAAVAQKGRAGRPVVKKLLVRKPWHPKLLLVNGEPCMAASSVCVNVKVDLTRKSSIRH